MSADTPPMQVTLIDWKPISRGTLRGWATVRAGALILHDIGVFNSGAKAWCSLPSKPLLDQSGSARRDDKNKIRYTACAEWADRSAADRFSAGVVIAIESVHPGATR